MLISWRPSDTLHVQPTLLSIIAIDAIADIMWYQTQDRPSRVPPASLPLLQPILLNEQKEVLQG